MSDGHFPISQPRFSSRRSHCRGCFVGIWLFCCLIHFAAFAQTNTNSSSVGPAASAPTAPANAQTNFSQVQFYEQLRSDCINNRRSICGRIIKVLPAGLVVQSGYTNLMREPLTRSWLVPGTATASLAPNLVESSEPGSMCVGVVFLSDYPKSRKTQPKLYDYVIIEGYPAGQYTYKSVGDLQKTVRHYSASLGEAVKQNYLAAVKN